VRTIHRRGFLDPRLDDLDALVGIARALSSKPTDVERVEEALDRAIDHKWGSSRLGDAMRLWFGVPAHDRDAPCTRALTSPGRLDAAWAYWGRGKRSTFRTSAASQRYDAISKALIELEVRAHAPEATHEGPQQRTTHRGNVRQLVPEEHTDAISSLGHLFEDALRLHEICVIYLSAQALDHALAENREGEQLRHQTDALLKPMWNAYRDLLFSSAYCLDAHVDTSIRGKVAAYLPIAVLTALDGALPQINAFVGNDNDTLANRALYLTYARGASDISSYRQLNDTIHSAFWRDLLLDRNNDPADFDSRIRSIVKYCRTLLVPLYDYIEPVDHAAVTRDTLRAATAYYGVKLDIQLAHASPLWSLLESAGWAVEVGVPFSLDEEQFFIMLDLVEDKLDIPRWLDPDYKIYEQRKTTSRS
jgi:hypothetical protein